MMTVIKNIHGTIYTFLKKSKNKLIIIILTVMTFLQHDTYALLANCHWGNHCRQTILKEKKISQCL